MKEYIDHLVLSIADGASYTFTMISSTELFARTLILLLSSNKDADVTWSMYLDQDRVLYGSMAWYNYDDPGFPMFLTVPEGESLVVTIENNSGATVDFDWAWKWTEEPQV